ncbi:MAG: site-specific integrase [Parasporobacterium sp.]|nr:site-specific integrase [Parasporobacterium sp.]
MASAYLKTTKDGKRFYEIHARNGNTQLTKRWYIPDEWSKKTIDSRLAKECVEFERQCRAGEVITRKQKAEAEELKALEEAKIRTFKDYANKVFMPALSITCSESCRCNYQQQLDCHILPALGAYKLPEITPAQITAFLLDKQSQGLKVGSVLKLYTIINSIFKKAYLEDAINKNPMDKVKRPKATKSEGKESQIKAYTEKELRYILESVRKEPLQWQVIINLMIDTGCRRGEITGLCWDCVDFKESTITIKRNLCYTPDKGIYIDTPKNGKTRKIYISTAVLALLRDLKAEQKPVLTIGSEKPSFVFTQAGTDEPMHPDTPTRYFATIGKRYGIEGFHPHKLRHSFASVAIKNGADVASVSERLGHSDKAVTLRMYTHADEESQKRAGEIFRAALFGNG